MAEIFADTSGWGHLVDASQKHHARAASIYRGARQRGDKFITTNYVVSELVALFTSPLRISRPKTIDFIAGLRSSPNVEIVHIDKSLDFAAWTLLAQRPDKSWSLVDSASFVVMQRRHLTEALTTDHHFEQAGFIRLLKD